MNKALAIGALLLMQAATAAEQPTPCAGPEYRQFDFWQGEWIVNSKDRKTMLGHSRIEPKLQGCVLHEHWQGKAGFQGESFNIYDRDDRQWHQSWVDQGGDRLELVGGLRGMAMVLEGRHAPKGKPARERISWTPQPDGRVRQLWETSTDGGRTWTVSFDGWYEHPAAP